VVVTLFILLFEPMISRTAEAFNCPGGHLSLDPSVECAWRGSDARLGSGAGKAAESGTDYADIAVTGVVCTVGFGLLPLLLLARAMRSEYLRGRMGLLVAPSAGRVLAKRGMLVAPSALTAEATEKAGGAEGARAVEKAGGAEEAWAVDAMLGEARAAVKAESLAGSDGRSDDTSKDVTKDNDTSKDVTKDNDTSKDVTKDNDTRSSDTRSSDTRSSDTRSSDTRSSDTRSSDTRSSDTRSSGKEGLLDEESSAKIKCLRTYGSLYLPFDHRYYYWQLLIMARKLGELTAPSATMGP
jgi:hypothetical protein